MSDLFAKAGNWRAPSRPREQACQTCGAAAPCGTGNAFYCLRCVPANYWPAKRRVADPGDVI